MRKLNVRFFVVLLVIIAAVGGGLYLVHQFQRDRIARALIYQAERAAAEGHTEKAVQYYARYLEFRPDDAAVMVTLGGILEQQLEKLPAWQRSPGQVVYLYEEALKQQPGRDDLRRRVVGLFMLPRMRRYGDALTHLDELQRKFPEDGALWQQRGLCQDGLAQFEAAAEAFQKATQFPPDQVHSCELLARLLRKQLNRHRQADELIEAMVQRHASDPEAFLARARYRMEHNLGPIDGDAEQALAKAPENAEALLLTAKVRQQQAKPAEALALLDKGVMLYPADARFYRHAAWIDYHQRRPDAARERLQAGIVACPDAFELHTALAELLIQAKMFDRVEKIVADLKAKGVREERVLYLTARVAVEREQWPVAVATLEKLRPDARSNPELSVQVNLLLAQCHKQLGDADRQQESFKRIFEFDAHNAAAWQGLAALHATAGRLDEAIKAYQQLVTLPGAPETAWTDLARLTIARKLRTPNGTQSWQDVETLLAAIEKRQPNSAELALARGELLAAQKQTSAAANLLIAAAQKTKEVRLWLQAAHYAELAEGNGPAVLDAAERALGQRVEVRLKRAAILLARSHAEVLTSLPALEAPAPTFTPEQTAQLRAGLAEMYFAVHDYANVKRLMRALAAERPGDLPARLLLAEVALREKDRDALPPLLAEVAKIEPAGGPMTPLLEARYHILLAEEGEKPAADKARSLLAGLVEKRPNMPQVQTTLARLAEVDGDRPKAIQHYRKAIELGDADLRSHQRLVTLLVESRQPQAAEQVLQQVMTSGAMSPERQRQMLQTVSPLLNTPVIQKYVVQALPQAARDPSEHVWLGKMLWDTGERAKAIAEFRQASAAAGKVPDNWITLVRALAADNQLDEAKRAMAEARKQLPPDRAAATLAVCLESAKQFDAAAAEYAAALQQSPHDTLLLRRYTRLLLGMGRMQQAYDLLRQTVEQPGPLAKEDVAWARRHLAILGTAGRQMEQFDRAFALLAQNEKECGEALEDLRAKVVLLAHLPPTGAGASPRRQAIGVLEKIVRHPLALPQDRYSLAKLYDAERDWEKAEAQYRSVIAADPKNPAPLTYFVRRLIQLELYDKAAEPLARLERLNPAAPPTVALRSRYHFNRGEVDQLLAHLTTYAAGRDLAPAEKAEREFNAGTLFDEFARSAMQPAGDPKAPQRLYKAAIEMYQRSVNRKPEAVIRAAALMSHDRFKQLDRAPAWLESPQFPQDVNLKASALLASLRSGHAKDAECRKAEAWLAEQARQHRNLELAMHRADLMELQHRFDEAEALYREVLAKQPSHIVALNNLAWVLANRGASKEALALAQRAIALAGPVPDLLDTRAKAYLALGRAPEAIQDLEDAISEAPSAMRYFQLALAQELHANPNAAKNAFALAKRHGLDARDLHPGDAKQFERLTKG